MAGQGFGKQSQDEPRKHRTFDLRADRSTAMLSNLPPGTSSQQYLDWLDENRDLLASFSYGSSLAEGAGIVFVDWDQSLSKLLPLVAPASLTPYRIGMRAYLPLAMLFVGCRSVLYEPFFEAGLMTEQWRRFFQYDPATVVTVALCWGMQLDRLGGRMVRSFGSLGLTSTPKYIYEHGGKERLIEHEAPDIGEQ